MRRTAPASIAALAAAVALASACNSAGTGTFNPLDPYEPAPTSTDTPTSSWEQPPASGDTPPSSDDPVPGQACTGCQGTFTCNEDGSTFDITLTESNGVCNLAATADGMTASAEASCGDQTGDAGASGQSGISYSVGANGNLTACEDSTCIVCTAGGAGASNTDAGGGTTVTISGTDSCTSLSTCCSSLPKLEQGSCLTIAQGGDDSVCQDTLAGFEDDQLCD